MFSRIREILIYTSVIKDENGRVRKQIMEDNRKSAIIWSVILIIYWIICLMLSAGNILYANCRSIYFTALCIHIFTLFTATFIAPKAPRVIRPMLFIIEIAFAGVGIGTALCNPGEKTVTFVAVLLIAPIMFVEDILPSVLIAVASILTCVFAGPQSMGSEIYHWMLTDVLLYSFAGILFGYFINKARFERYIYAESAVKLAELQTRYAYFDQMTGLQNRRAYSEQIEAFAKKKPPYCCIIMADVNGLKQINDTLGHEAGDELIVGSAECLRQGFQGVERIYRLGGDEFSIILTDRNIDAGKCLDRMEKISSGWKGRLVNSISISYGFASSEEFSNIASVEKEADRRMYEFKQNYYISSGKDRRGSS